MWLMVVFASVLYCAFAAAVLLRPLALLQFSLFLCTPQPLRWG
jgi:hypothetical protein